MSYSNLWKKYSETRSIEDRNTLVEHYMYMTKIIASQMYRYGDRDELLSSACLGLIQAVEGFDPNRGIKFTTYATPRIKGCILDENIRMDFLGQTMRKEKQKIRRDYEYLAHKLKHFPTLMDLAKHRHISEDEAFEKMKSNINHESIGEWVVGDTGVDVVSEELNRKEFYASITSKIKEQHKEMIMMRYYEQMSMVEISSLKKLCSSRVYQVLDAAIEEIKGAFGTKGSYDGI